MGKFYFDIEQSSPEWHAIKCGKVSASRVADIVRKTKTGISASRNTYMGELVAERLSGQPQASFSSKPMEWGKETEAAAREMYAFATGATIKTVGFVDHDKIAWAGASPDSLINEDGLLEVKCPLSATHISSLLGASIDPDYEKQMQWQMACTGRQWCDWVSFDPRLPPEMQMHVRRVHRNPIVIAELESAVIAFNREVEEKIAALRKAFGSQMAA